jgi:FKBP-type peptidyl-prolyl cis-trans isomerase FklB
MKELSYQIGLLVGSNLANQVQAEDMDMLSIARGIEDALKGNADDEAMLTASQQVQSYMQDVMTSRAQDSMEEEKAFMEYNSRRSEVTTTSSGLQYEILKAGEGKIPSARNTVVAHYEGKLLDGTIFDSSYQRGQAATFPVSNLIAGWQEALQLMPTGSKWRLFIPHQLAYGERGAGADIPPFATLIFDLELISIAG